MIEQQIPGYCLYYCDENCIQKNLSYEFSASFIFSILTILISIYHISMHLANFNNPFFQSKIIVIMIMAPFYCITSIGSFKFPHLEIYFTLFRDSYEAVLLFTFFYLMFSYLAYDRQKDEIQDKKVYTIMIAHEKEIHHFWPVYYCQKPYQLTHWKKAKYFTYRCKKYVLQFLVVKCFTTLLMSLIYPNQGQEVHDETYVEQDHAIYNFVSSVVSWTVGISASYSLYYLVLFYHALNKPLAPYSALLKFLTIKVTIFFTFWQKICIIMFEEQILSCFNHEAPSFDGHAIVSSIENTLICFEMLLMAIAGGLAYNYQNYVSVIATNKGSFSFVLHDTIRAFKNDFRLIKPKKFGFDTKNTEQIELKQIKINARQSVVCSININNMKSITQSIIHDYL